MLFHPWRGRHSLPDRRLPNSRKLAAYCGGAIAQQQRRLLRSLNEGRASGCGLAIRGGATRYVGAAANIPVTDASTRVSIPMINPLLLRSWKLIAYRPEKYDGRRL